MSPIPVLLSPGRIPLQRACAGDITAPAGQSAKADHVVIDGRGIAATGSVTKIDLTSLAPMAQIMVELHPVALAWDEAVLFYGV